MLKIKINYLFLIGLVISLFTILILQTAASQGVSATVCCEKTKTGLSCQNVPSEQCDPSSTQVPTACESTSFCKPGVCYNSGEGTCSGNTPQLVCNNNNGTWSETSPPQCDLGCCVLGDQAAFVTLVRCKKLSAFLGLQANFKKEIKNEVACVLSVQNQDKGACVFESEFERTCKYTTREECGAGIKGEFFVNKLCSAEELGTKCGPTTKTLCVPGKDEVYFVDSCGNPANIYDASKVNDKEYWANVKDKSEVCNPNSANAESSGCGNCNYLLGSICRSSEDAGKSATYGDNICADLNCRNTQNGNSYKHGESWCVYSDKGLEDKSNNAVGSRFYKHICINGDEVLEQCADFRQEECIEDKITTTVGDFSQAACRVNRWQDCVAQTEKLDCENSDRRDCTWKEGVTLGNATGKGGACLPKNTPGLKFWEGNEAQGICAQGNARCIVTFEKGLFEGEECKDNCECLEDSWVKQRADVCTALGDCGPKINWVGDSGYKSGYNVTIKSVKTE